MQHAIRLALLMGLTAGPALAQSGGETYAVRSGGDLGRICADPAGNAITPAERERLLVCGAYIRGYLGYYTAARSLDRTQSFCLPADGVTAEKLRQLYVGVLKRQPQIRDYPAAIGLATILKAGYPCTR